MPRSSKSFFTRSMAPVWTNALIAALVILPVTVDLMTDRITPAALYVLALLLYAQSRRTKHLWLFTALLVALTYLFFLLDLQHLAHDHLATHGCRRFLNRTFSAAAIVASAVLLRTWIGFRDYWSNQTGTVLIRERSIYRSTPLFQIFDQFVATGLMILIIVALFLTDVFTPVYYNIPILYAIPMLLAAITFSRPLIWTTLACSVLAGYIGFQFGHDAAADDTTLALVAGNRLIAGCTLLGMALLFHFWVTRAIRPTSGDEATGPPSVSA